jgi:hypothetical protein
MADPAYIVNGTLTDGEAWVPISTSTVVGTSTGTITFTSTDDGQVGDFSQYMDLVLITYAGCIVDGDGGNYIYYYLNNDTTSANYIIQYAKGDGSSASANSHAWNLLGYMTGTKASVANVMTSCVIRWTDINSGKFKACVSLNGQEKNTGTSHFYYINNVWEKPEPITEIDLFEPNAYNFKEGSVFSLFGVLPRMVA